MTEFVASNDGIQLAYDVVGTGPAVVLIAAAMQFRGFDPNTVEMAGRLAAKGYTVLNFDRRGRGESERPFPCTLDETIHDIRILIDLVAGEGGSAALYGSSSGGSIALAAAAAGLPVSQLVLWETPLGPDGGDDGADFLMGLRKILRTGDGNAAVEFYMKDMPREWLDGAKSSPAWPVMVQMAPSLEPDAESLAWAQSAPRAELWAGVTQPTLAVVGEQTLPIMHSAADSIAEWMPNARKVEMPGENHGWEPEVMATQIAGFLAESAASSASANDPA